MNSHSYISVATALSPQCSLYRSDMGCTSGSKFNTTRTRNKLKPHNPCVDVQCLKIQELQNLSSAIQQNHKATYTLCPSIKLSIYMFQELSALSKGAHWPRTTVIKDRHSSQHFLPFLHNACQAPFTYSSPTRDQSAISCRKVLSRFVLTCLSGRLKELRLCV